MYSNTCFDSENQIGPTSKSNIKRNGEKEEEEEEEEEEKEEKERK